MIQAVIFDVGGVLKQETDTAIRRDVQQTLGIAPEAFEEPWRMLTDQLGRGVIEETEFWEQLHALAKAEHPVPEESLLMREYAKGHRPNDDVLAIAHQLREAGYATAILSNTNVRHASFNREHGLYSGFDPLILSHEVHMRKPAPEIFQHALERLDIAPDQAVLVDDLEKNIAAARDLGMGAILFTSAPQLTEELRTLGLAW